ncbi:hypothetical protein EQP59_02835 [Ornithobacterium rhinotracheale]|uniref:Uncharacterized protein n=1 Tax=Ornithobacterium rhinotracheale TaxID=28251 RepID=A0A3R5UUY0_ORNRH|nr:hypothetical protein [Ornithobacterium rhinotracheale]QAR30364.1 hypothetical protein EQP59_02835 [Ornithobacterium rhinotracheale]
MGRVEDKMLKEFLDNKENLLLEFSKIVNVKNLKYTIKELRSIENNMMRLLCDEKISELYNIYIGEVLLKNIKGEWSIGKFKKDLAYHKPIILKEDKNKMRLCPIADWFELLKMGKLKDGISGMVLRVIEFENIN